MLNKKGFIILQGSNNKRLDWHIKQFGQQNTTFKWINLKDKPGCLPAFYPIKISIRLVIQDFLMVSDIIYMLKVDVYMVVQNHRDD